MGGLEDRLGRSVQPPEDPDTENPWIFGFYRQHAPLHACGHLVRTS